MRPPRPPPGNTAGLLAFVGAAGLVVAAPALFVEDRNRGLWVALDEQNRDPQALKIQQELQQQQQQGGRSAAAAAVAKGAGDKGGGGQRCWRQGQRWPKVAGGKGGGGRRRQSNVWGARGGVCGGSETAAAVKGAGHGGTGAAAGKGMVGVAAAVGASQPRVGRGQGGHASRSTAPKPLWNQLRNPENSILILCFLF